jgi:hypothetical protein
MPLCCCGFDRYYRSVSQVVTVMNGNGAHFETRKQLANRMNVATGRTRISQTALFCCSLIAASEILKPSHIVMGRLRLGCSAVHPLQYMLKLGIR